MYNASKTLERMLHSLYGQSYNNWKVIIIDDVSDKNEITNCINIIKRFDEFDTSKIDLIVNDRKKWEVENVLTGIKRCPSESIICRLDADDWLTDLDALYILNEAYKQTECDIAWSAHRWGFTNFNISGPFDDSKSAYTQDWRTSHLKTFRKRLIENVPDENFRNMNGDYVKRAGDQAIYLPCLERSKKKFFVPLVLYHYTIDTNDPSLFTKDDSIFQKDEADFLRKRGYISSGESWEDFIE